MKIRLFRHRGLKRFVEDDDARALRRGLVGRIRRVVTALVLAANEHSILGPPGWRIHKRRPCRNLEHQRFGQLADYVSGRGGRNRRLEFGGLPLMNRGRRPIGMKPSHPGEFIRTEIIEELGLSITKAAEILDIRRATLSDLLNEKASLSPEMALRVEMAFGLDMDTMLRMQVWHDAHGVRQRASEINVQRYDVPERV